MGDSRREQLSREQLLERLSETERERDEARDTLAAIMTSSDDHVMLLDCDARILYINYTVPDLTPDQVLGNSIFNYMPESWHQPAKDAFARVLELGEPSSYACEYEDTNDGTRSYFESRVFPITHDGVVTSMTVIAQNVTERRRQEIERERFFNISRDLLCAVEDGAFVRANPAFELVLGYSPDELLQTSMDELIHPADLEHTRAHLAELQGGQDCVELENRYRHKDGRYRTISWMCSADPKTGQIYGVGRDLTDRIELEAQLRQSHKLEAVGSLAGGIAHDFNNIMLSILMNTAHGLRILDDDDELRSNLNEIQLGAQRAARLTSQLLTFARKSDLDAGPVDVNGIAESVVVMLRRLIPATHALSFVPGRDLPAARADRGQLEQVIMNLCVNARDAMAGGGEIRLSTREATVDDEYRPDAALADGRYVVITVEDTGVGMEPEVVERAFEPFFTTKGPGEGTGLGLASVYGVMKQHDGAVVVRSEIGVGSVFEAFFPIAKGPLVANGADEIEAAGGTETILVAEDSRAVRESVVQLLKAEGYSVLVAENGAEAVEVFTANPDIDLVLLDVVMPYKTGPEAQREMAQMGRKARYLFTSGYSDGALPARMQSEGLRLLAKPYTPDQLLVELRRALDSD